MIACEPRKLLADMPTPDPNDPFETPVQAARRRQITISAVYKAIHSGRLHPHVIAGHWMLLKAEVDAWEIKRGPKSQSGR